MVAHCVGETESVKVACPERCIVSATSTISISRDLPFVKASENARPCRY